MSKKTNRSSVKKAAALRAAKIYRARVRTLKKNEKVGKGQELKVEQKLQKQNVNYDRQISDGGTVTDFERTDANSNIIAIVEVKTGSWGRASQLRQLIDRAADRCDYVTAEGERLIIVETFKKGGLPAEAKAQQDYAKSKGVKICLTNNPAIKTLRPIGQWLKETSPNKVKAWLGKQSKQGLERQGPEVAKWFEKQRNLGQVISEMRSRSGALAAWLKDAGKSGQHRFVAPKTTEALKEQAKETSGRSPNRAATKLGSRPSSRSATPKPVGTPTGQHSSPRAPVKAVTKLASRQSNRLAPPKPVAKLTGQQSSPQTPPKAATKLGSRPSSRSATPKPVGTPTGQHSSPRAPVKAVTKLASRPSGRLAAPKPVAKPTGQQSSPKTPLKAATKLGSRQTSRAVSSKTNPRPVAQRTLPAPKQNGLRAGGPTATKPFLTSKTPGLKTPAPTPGAKVPSQPQGRVAPPKVQGPSGPAKTSRPGTSAKAVPRPAGAPGAQTRLAAAKAGVPQSAAISLKGNGPALQRGGSALHKSQAPRV